MINHYTFLRHEKSGFIWVLIVHALVLLFFNINFPPLINRQIEPLSVELGAAPAPSAGINQERGVKSTNKAQRESLKKKSHADGIPQNLPIIQESSRGGLTSDRPAAAPTSDSNKSLKILKNIKPAYPPLAYKMRTEGTVLLQVEVLPNGRVGVLKVIHSSGSELLDNSALDAVRLWEFSVPSNASVSQLIKIPIIFNLKNR